MLGKCWSRLSQSKGHPALADDGPHRAAREVSMVHGNHGAELSLGVNEEELASAVLAVFDEASSLQHLDYLLRGEAPEVLHAAGAWIWTKGIGREVSSGTDRPSSAREER
jgi:hypothetical protein